MTDKLSSRDKKKKKESVAKGIGKAIANKLQGDRNKKFLGAIL